MGSISNFGGGQSTMYSIRRCTITVCTIAIALPHSSQDARNAGDQKLGKMLSHHFEVSVQLFKVSLMILPRLRRPRACCRARVRPLNESMSISCESMN